MGDLSEMDARAAADRGDDSDEAVSELQCRELFRNIREGFFVGEIVRDDCGHAIDFIFRSINAAFTDQTGLTADEAIGRRVTDAIPGLQRFLIETYGKVVETGRSAAFEVEIQALANRTN
jgi:PAS domain-containing protein